MSEAKRAAVYDGLSALKDLIISCDTDITVAEIELKRLNRRRDTLFNLWQVLRDASVKAEIISEVSEDQNETTRT